MAASLIPGSQTLEVALADILVDPSAFSPRVRPIDDEYVARLADVLRDGAVLPPLSVARPSDPTAPWCSGVAIHTTAAAVERQRHMKDDPRSWLPPAPSMVLYDGHHTWWALRELGVKKALVRLHDVPVSGEDDLRALALDANLRHGRQLDDPDLRHAFTLLWLGRPTRETHENWLPVKGRGMEPSDIAALLKRSLAWASMMTSYVKVHQAVTVDLGLRKSCHLAKLDETRWHDFVWQTNGEPRIYVPLDSGLSPRVAAGAFTIAEMSSSDVERLVRRALMQTPPPPQRTVDPPVERPKLSLVDIPHYDGELDFGGFTDYRDRALGLYHVADQLDKEQTADAIRAVRPVYVTSAQTLEALARHARHIGLDMEE
jgi:hypothetical protein